MTMRLFIKQSEDKVLLINLVTQFSNNMSTPEKIIGKTLNLSKRIACLVKFEFQEVLSAKRAKY